jgi:hypothetical protein
MFGKLAKQLESHTLGHGNKYFNISKEEFEDFCKGFLFEKIKGELKLGDAFCKKYNESNYVLSILPDESAIEHIKKFYVK